MASLNLANVGPVWAIGLAAVTAAVAWRLHMLNGSGALAATLLGGAVLGLGGWPWAILLLAFFGSSSLLSRAFSRRKKRAAADFAKGGQRDGAQVAANGGAAILFLLAAAWGGLQVELGWAAFAGALAAVTADTWATELGVLSKRPPRLITTGEPVPAGRSGGISLTGNLASLAGAALIASLAAWWGGGIAGFAVVTVAGMTGSLLDSLLGATVQRMYYCPACRKETERHPTHSCGTPTEPVRGWARLDNDWVNFLSSLAAAGLALGLRLVG